MVRWFKERPKDVCGVFRMGVCVLMMFVWTRLCGGERFEDEIGDLGVVGFWPNLCQILIGRKNI